MKQIRRSLRRRPVVALCVVTAGSMSGVLVGSGPTEAFQLSGCYADTGRGSPLPFSVSGSNRYVQLSSGAAASWNTSVGQNVLASTGGGQGLVIEAVNLGNISLDGMFRQRNASVGVPPCPNGSYANAATAITINTFYGDVYSDSRVRALVAHELGHPLGLGHFEDTVSSCGGNMRAIAIMHSSSSIRSGSGACAVTVPTVDDVAGVRPVSGGGGK